MRTGEGGAVLNEPPVCLLRWGMDGPAVLLTVDRSRPALPTLEGRTGRVVAVALDDGHAITVGVVRTRVIKQVDPVETHELLRLLAEAGPGTTELVPEAGREVLGVGAVPDAVKRRIAHVAEVVLVRVLLVGVAGGGAVVGVVEHAVVVVVGVERVADAVTVRVRTGDVVAARCRVAGVVRARVLVIAVRDRPAFAGIGRALVRDRARVVVTTRGSVRHVDAPGLRVARVVGAGVLVVALDLFLPDACAGHTEVIDRARTLVRARLLSVGVSDVQTSGHRVAGVDSADVAVIHADDVLVRATLDRVARVGRARVEVVAVHGRAFARAGCRDTLLGRADRLVRAIDIRLTTVGEGRAGLAAGRRVAHLGAVAEFSVIAVDERSFLAFARQTGVVHGARVVVGAGRVVVSMRTARCRVARVVGADVAVIAPDRLAEAFALDTRVAEGAGATVVAVRAALVVHEVARAGLRVACGLLTRPVLRRIAGDDRILVDDTLVAEADERSVTEVHVLELDAVSGIETGARVRARLALTSLAEVALRARVAVFAGVLVVCVHTPGRRFAAVVRAGVVVVALGRGTLAHPSLAEVVRGARVAIVAGVVVVRVDALPIDAGVGRARIRVVADTLGRLDVLLCVWLDLGGFATGFSRAIVRGVRTADFFCDFVRIGRMILHLGRGGEPVVRDGVAGIGATVSHSRRGLVDLAGVVAGAADHGIAGVRTGPDHRLTKIVLGPTISIDLTSLTAPTSHHEHHRHQEHRRNHLEALHFVVLPLMNLFNSRPSPRPSG